MSSRTSFELHADGCRVVDVDVRPMAARRPRARIRVGPHVPGGRRRAPISRPRWRSSGRTGSSRPTRASPSGVCRSSYQFLRLPPAKDADLDALATREARKEIAPLEVDGAGACVAIAVGPDVQVGTHRRREVSLVAVSEADVRRQIQPITDAGFVVSRVVTPAIALTAVARSCNDLVPGSTMAYVALTSRATCVAIVRDGLLLFAREIPWGHAEAEHEPVETRLASELRRSILFFRQTFRSGVDGVVLCGDAANLRALTAPVGAALSIPVQTLDSLNGIDADRVPEPAETFRADVASLRLAIAVGAEAVTYANLLPASIRESREARTMTRRAVAASRGRRADRDRLVCARQLLVRRSRPRCGTSSGESRSSSRSRSVAPGCSDPRRSPRCKRRRCRHSSPRGHGSLGSSSCCRRDTPSEIALTAIDVQADGGYWRTTIQGLAVTRDVAAGQSAVNRLLLRLSESPLVGPAVQPPSFRLISGAPSGRAAAAGEMRPVPDGMSGVEFAMQFQVPR